MSKKLTLVLCALFLIGAAVTGAQAQTVVDVAEDTYLDGWDGGTAMGVANPSWVIQGIFESGRTRIGLVKFNLPSLTAAVAKLSLPVVSVWGASGSSSYTVESIANTWNENTATASNTWGLISPVWADGIVLDSKVINSSVVGSRLEWDVTSAVLAAGPGGTVSFYIAIDHYMPMVENAWSFNTKEGDPTLTNTAKLLLTPVPEPGSMMALSAGLIGLCGFFRRRR